MGIESATLVVPGQRAQVIVHFTPAGGPLDRHAARPGAWYTLLYLAVAPQCPAQLTLWGRPPHHEMRLYALDAAPDEAPSVVDPLPVVVNGGGAALNPSWSSRFVTPASSAAQAIFVLVEQWRSDGEAPRSLKLQLLPMRANPGVNPPWWAGPSLPAATPPPGPLSRPGRPRVAPPHEIPIYFLPAQADTRMPR